MRIICDQAGKGKDCAECFHSKEHMTDMHDCAKTAGNCLSADGKEMIRSICVKPFHIVKE
jgi:hypothetical protein